MKHLKHLAATVAMLLCCITASAQTFVVDGLQYSVTSTTDLTVSVKQGSTRPTGDLVIPASVTYDAKEYCVKSIENDAFEYCTKLTSITIGNSVMSIGEDAFYGCSALTSLTIPNSVTSIGEDAFHSCSGLKELTFEDGEGVLTLGGYNVMFSYCPLETLYLGRDLSYSDGFLNAPFSYITTLTSVTLGDKVTSLSKNLFYGCSGLTSLTIPNSVTSIGSSVFYNCSGLTSIAIPNSVTSIGLSAFYGCSGLTSIAIPNSVTSIGLSAFYGCSGLTLLTIPNSVTSIGSSAFYNCSGLTSLTIPNSVTSIGSSAFYNCSGLTSLTIGNSVTSIGENAFNGCSSLKNLFIEDGDGVLTLDSRYAMFSSCPLETLYLGRDLSYSDDDYRNRPFYEQTKLSSVVIGDKVTTIHNNFFNGCSGLTSLTIGNGVTSIGSNAFSGCSGLKTVNVSSVESWLRIKFGTSTSNPCYYAGHFYVNGKKVDKIEVPESITAISDNAFYNCSGLTSITIPNSVTSIGSSAFYNCSNLTSITIPNHVTSIGSNAFSGCSDLKELTFEDGEGVLTLGSGMFSNCPLETLYLGRDLSYSTSTISTTPFYDKNALTSVTISDKVTSLSSGLFYSCNGLTSITIPNSVASIGSSAFAGCIGLTSMIIPNSVTSIGSYAFSSCSGLTSMTIGNSVTSIGEAAFQDCSGLTSMTIGNSVTSIGNDAFYGCSKLKTVNVSSVESWLRIKFSSWRSNPCYNAGRFYVDGERVENIEVPESITEISNYAFYNCSGLTSVTMGSSVTSIGKEAFYKASVESFTLGSGVKEIGSGAFGSNSHPITNLPRDLYLTDLEAFMKIKFGNRSSYPNVDRVENIYLNGELITEIEIPTSVTSIPNYTFYNFSDVASVKLHEGVESIGEYAFYNVPAVFEVAATTPPTLGDQAIGSSPSVVVVPKEAAAAYSAAEGWSELAMTNNEVGTKTLTLQAADAESALHRVLGDAKLDSVVNLTINGSINSYDFMVLRTKMTKLRKLDLTNAIVKYNTYQHYAGYHTEDNIIPAYAFYKCNLFSLKTPLGTKSIDRYACYGNAYLRELDLVEGITSIGNYAFTNCYKLAEVSFPTTLELIGENAFSGSSSYSNNLRIVDLSHTHLTSIGSSAFEFNTKLEEVKLPAATLKTISEQAFRGCSSLKKFYIPSSVRTIGNEAFSRCSALNDVYVYTVEPISIGQNTFSTNGTQFVGTLHAPTQSYYTYWYNTQWGQFQDIVNFDDTYKYFYLVGDKTLDNSTGAIVGDTENPDAEMGNNSGLIVEDNVNQELGDVDIEHNGTDGGSIIVGGEGCVNADELHFHINVQGGRWYFFCFPFDVRREDIVLQNGANWVFRYYDGEERANNGKGGWKNVTSDGNGNHLKAATGYIFQCSKNDVLILTAKNQKIKQEKKYNELVEHVTQNAHDASWNFVGNPYLSYYEVTSDDYSAPITVWDGSKYIAIRPGDDDYQLAPFEAFFVQKPEGVANVDYIPERQMTYHQSQEAAAKACARRRAMPVNPDRLLVNITLSNGTDSDQTRVVFNNEAAMGYETACDAAKFETAGVPQIYTVDSRAVKYAINERPVAEGIVTLGYTAPAEGIYTLAAPRMDTPISIKDNLTGTIHDFAEGSYEFASEAGTFDDRFTVIMKAGETGIDKLETTDNSQQPIYDAAGRRVEKMEQGIYIKENRKVVIK